MTKPELINAVSEETGITKRDAEAAITVAMRAIATAIKKTGRFEYPGFGVFHKVRRAACLKHNPQNPAQKIQVAARNTVKFKPSPALKALVK